MNVFMNLEHLMQIAIDAKYHLQCLTELRNCYQSLERQRDQESKSLSEEKKIKARLFAELCSYIENCMEDGVHYFKFSDLHKNDLTVLTSRRR